MMEITPRAGLMTDLRVADLMSRPPQTCRIGDPLGSALEIMWQRDCGAVPVVDQHGQLAGMITDRDVALAAHERGLLELGTTVCTAMTKAPKSCAASASVADALGLMERHQVRRLPVTDDDGRLVGILTLADVARHAVGRPEDLRRVGAALAAICEPRTRGLRAAG